MPAKAKKIAVVLSGCGNKDGAEITESVSTLISIAELGATYECFAPNLEFVAKDHLTGKSEANKRNILHEAARIARGKIRDLSGLKADEFDGLVFPGGYGASTLLSGFAKDGAAGRLQPDVERIIREFHNEGKPIAAICIAPSLLALALGKKSATLTIGNDVQTASEIEKTGAHHESCAVTDYVTDRENKVVTTPAYMYDKATPYEVFTGIRKAIRELVEMA